MKSEMFLDHSFCCLSRVCTVGPWKYQSHHSDVCHSDKHISLYQCVIYWFHIMGEWFHIVEHFGGFYHVSLSFHHEWNSGVNCQQVWQRRRRKIMWPHLQHHHVHIYKAKRERAASQGPMRKKWNAKRLPRSTKDKSIIGFHLCLLLRNFTFLPRIYPSLAM